MLLICLLANFVVPSVARAELATLFTTPQERQLINANRYKQEKKTQVTATQQTKEVEVQTIVRKEVNKSFNISGITVSNEGAHSVWINNQFYEDGEKIEGSSRVKVIVGSEIKVRITAPDGKHYFGTSGETVKVSYLEVSET